MIKHPSGDLHWTRQRPDLIKRGADSHAAKLSSADVEALCEHFKAYRPTQSWLARKFGVTRVTVWRHLKTAGLV
jgi:transcriptional regulator of acetoin/glycerol metabolism